MVVQGCPPPGLLSPSSCLLSSLTSLLPPPPPHRDHLPAVLPLHRLWQRLQRNNKHREYTFFIHDYMVVTAHALDLRIRKNTVMIYSALSFCVAHPFLCLSCKVSAVLSQLLRAFIDGCQSVNFWAWRLSGNGL